MTKPLGPSSITPILVSRWLKRRFMMDFEEMQWERINVLGYDIVEVGPPDEPARWSLRRRPRPGDVDSE